MRSILTSLTALSLPNNEILDCSKLKAFADDNLTLSQTSPGFYMSAVQVL